ncbi:MAG: type IV pilus modification PilV family protein [Phycisphaerales bacterium]
MMTQLPSTTHHSHQRGFSLVEMLFAIFILGIGVVSVAALFPVGLTQQQRSADAVIGPTIANNAMELIRTKVSADDFGYLNLTPGGPYEDGYLTIQGDFKWRRPSFVLADTTIVDQLGASRPVSAGSINLFQNANTATELPYNDIKWGAAPPAIIISQEERYFPAQSTELIAAGTTGRTPPQYAWDCMFRRFQGKMYVAVFVYRISTTGGEPVPFQVRTGMPIMPHYRALNGSGNAGNPWPLGTEEIPGTYPGDPINLNPLDPPDDQWQLPGQWLLDQNNVFHRVLAGRRNDVDGPVRLQRPVQESRFFRAVLSQDFSTDDPVFELWYIPSVVIDPNIGREYRLSPIYATVKEL